MSKPMVVEGQWFVDAQGDLAKAIMYEDKLQQLWWSKNSKHWIVTDTWMGDGWATPIDDYMVKLIMSSNNIPPPEIP